MNDEICCNFVFEIELMVIEDVKVKGVMVLFGEKYDDEVCVVIIGDYLIELCGGIYVKCVGDIGLFKIVLESGIVVGICCIEVVIGVEVVVYVSE